MNEARRCKTCRYWVDQHCLRFPPVAQPGYLALFPKVPESAWCGEWMMMKGSAK